MSYRLFIDDERDPPKGPWIVVRSSAEAIETVKNRGLPFYISFDHDLGGDDTSMKFIDWLIEMVLDLRSLGIEMKNIKFPFPDYFIHSQNPVGRDNIRARIESFRVYFDLSV